ncbi:hypothetical protein [uncultured Gammaproteobacteria bacterium]|nr:hypothetical protein [uncultured Gammaproteobacteria bacterium]
MLVLNDKLKHPSLIDLDNVENSVLVKNVIQQVKNYQEQLRKLGQRGGMKDSELKALEPQLPTWWSYELKAMKETDPNKKNEIYLKGLKEYPKSFELCVDYANFLTIIGKDHDQAEKHYKKALELEPNDAAVNGNYAKFLLIKGEESQAQVYLDKAFNSVDNQQDLLVELWFYRLAHYPDYRQQAIEQLDVLLEMGESQ